MKITTTVRGSGKYAWTETRAEDPETGVLLAAGRYYPEHRSARLYTPENLRASAEKHGPSYALQMSRGKAYYNLSEQDLITLVKEATNGPN
jgi:hypothetical protein